MSKTKFVNGVNPEALRQWKKEDHEERVRACEDVLRAICHLEMLYEVPSESEHPLEQAYALIYDFAESEGLVD